MSGLPSPIDRPGTVTPGRPPRGSWLATAVRLLADPPMIGAHGLGVVTQEDLARTLPKEANIACGTTADAMTNGPSEAMTTFADLQLRPELLTVLSTLGYE